LNSPEALTNVTSGLKTRRYYGIKVAGKMNRARECAAEVVSVRSKPVGLLMKPYLCERFQGEHSSPYPRIADRI
jgi:hypothetical protein